MTGPVRAGQAAAEDAGAPALPNKRISECVGTPNGVAGDGENVISAGSRDFAVEKVCAAAGGHRS
jgi:hypothetical protein